jgi:hypothetical protein
MAAQPKSGPGLPFCGFVTVTFLRGWIVSPAPNPQPGGPGLRIYDPRRRWRSYTPRHWVLILVAVYDMHGLQWDCSLIPASARDSTLLFIHFFFLVCGHDVSYKSRKSRFCHGGEDVDGGLLGCNIVWTCQSFRGTYHLHLGVPTQEIITDV